MPFVMDYTAPDASNYPLSFWIISLISLNHLARTGIVHINGYGTIDDFFAGSAFMHQEAVPIDHEIYDAYVRYQLERPDDIFSFYVFLEGTIIASTDFFAGSNVYSVTQPMALEIGGDADNRVNVGFSNVLTGVPSMAGVVIKVNGTPATITAADQNLGYTFPDANPQPTFIAYYDLSANVPVGAGVTWDYDGGAVFGGSGTLTDPSLNPLYKFIQLDVDTTIGERLRFSRASNSGQLITLGVF